MSNRKELESYLRTGIPLSAAMDVTVERADSTSVRLSSPPNRPNAKVA